MTTNTAMYDTGIDSSGDLGIYSPGFSIRVWPT